MGYLIERLLALVLLLILLPFLLPVFLAVKLEDGGPVFFFQKRAGKGKKPFTMYKIRTMLTRAEEMKKYLLSKNEADGPAFKIRSDPRHTRLGRLLAHTGIDEIPQLVNIFKGEMSFVGPRPLPLGEAKLVPDKFRKRFSVLPGITSTWVVKGSHSLSFEEWMRLDLMDAKNAGFVNSISVLIQTAGVMTKELYKKVKQRPWLGLTILVFGLGLFLRLYMALNRALWADEAFYFEVATQNSWLDILVTNHWIKDNPPFFFLFLKFWSLVSKSILWLRLPGIMLYSLSFFLIYKLFKSLNKVNLLIIFFLFSLSTYFIYLNYWITPFNFVLVFALIQLLLLKGFFDSKISKGVFILFFVITNALLINTHYVSLYVFLSYPVFLLYAYFKARRLFLTIFEACLISLLLVSPTLYNLYRLKEEIYTFQQQDVGGLSFGSYWQTLVYVFDRSLLRIFNPKLAGYITFSLLLLVLGGFLLVRRKILEFFSLTFFAVFVTSTFFLFVFGRLLPSMLGERPWLIIHLGFYFTVAIALVVVSKVNRYLPFLILSLVVFLSIKTLFFELSPLGRYRFPGQVSVNILSKSAYSNFTSSLSSLKSDDFDTVVYWGDNMKINHVKFVFLNYYLKYDPSLTDLSSKNTVVSDDLENLEKKLTGVKKILFVSFAGNLDKKRLLDSDALKKQPSQLVDFWSYMVGRRNHE